MFFFFFVIIVKILLFLCLFLIFLLLIINFLIFFLLKTVYFKSPNVLSNPSVQTEFDNYTASLVTSSLSNDTLSMHFYIANANDFFQTDFPQSLGNFSLKDMKESQTDCIKQIKKI